MGETRAAGEGAAGAPAGPLSVAVLVELVRSRSAGGHVKCWERFAEAAAAASRGGHTAVDLTVYVLGDHEYVEPLSPRVRFVGLRPVLSTAPLTRAIGGDVADMAPYHPRLARLLPRHDVWHLTHTFAFAATAGRLARRASRSGAGRPGLVCSVHTDVPALASVYVRQLARRVPRPAGPAARGASEFVGTVVRWRRDRLLRMCDRVLVGSSQDRAEIEAVVGRERVALLRRGTDHERFGPDPTARDALAREHGIPGDRPLVLFAGRVDETKRVWTVAEAVHRVRQRRPVHLVVAGAGADAGRIARLLGPDVTLLGALAQERLAGVYAACDLFAFPSRTETVGNVVAEAMASGLPVVLPEGARTTQWLAEPGADGLVVRDDDPTGWTRALDTLLAHPDRRRAMGLRAAATARERHPSWGRVLTEDLLPAWHEAAARGTRPHPRRA
ncbi:glycosyltransferase [Streptomyces sp. bgisy159]|uniref:glycosyltransferase n=1 Tax=Streptomyces sp. bgisy159 TaxID=3413795 RepID=UPI003F49D787